MINDFQKGYSLSIFEELPLIKNISYENDSGKYYLLDNKGNNYICDIYGRQKPEFKENISGFINGNQRKSLEKIKSHPNIIYSKYAQINSSNKLKTEDDKKAYYPSILKFEGYTHFPRPVCPPFTNVPDSIMNKNYKKLLISQIENKIAADENKNYFMKQNENNGLSYLTSDIKAFLDKEKEKRDDINNNKKKDYKLVLIDMIDNTIEKLKIENECDLRELIINNSKARALLNLKKNLLNNHGINIINGRQLKDPKAHIINEYKIVHNTLFKNEPKKLTKCFSQINIKKTNLISNNEDNLYGKGRRKLKKIVLHKNLNKKDSASTQNMIIKPKKEEKITDLLQFIKYTKENNNYNISQSQNIYDEQETKESLGTRGNSNIYNFRLNTNESNKEDNLSIISFLNEKENKRFIQFNKKIKFFKAIKAFSDKEKKNLIGFKKEEPKKPKLLNVEEEADQPKYRDFMEIYKKEQETLEKLNPILFNIQKKKEENEMKKMIKKKYFKKLNEKLMMKGKTLKKSISSLK